MRYFSRAGLLLACLFCFSGCGGEEFAYHSSRQLKPGPGLLSGEDGEFVILGKSAAQREADATKAQEQNQVEEAEAQNVRQ